MNMIYQKKWKQLISNDFRWLSLGMVLFLILFYNNAIAQTCFPAYGINNDTGMFVGVNPATGVQTDLAPVVTGEFIGGGEIVNGVYYTGGTSLGNIYSINPATGAVTTVIAGCGSAITGLEVDPTTGIFYALNIPAGCQNGSQLLQIDLVANTCTPIG